MADEPVVEQHSGEVTEEELTHFLNSLSVSLVDAIVGDGEALTIDVIRRRAAQLLSGDEGARTVLGSIYESARADAFAEVAVARPASAAKPRWEDVSSPGERKARWRADSLCNRCSLSMMCVLARSTPVESLAVVSRCLSFSEVKR